MLWWWVIENRELGDLANLYDQDIATACEWRGDPVKLLKALKKHGWITKDMKINDWDEYAGRLLGNRERLRKWRKKQSNDVSGNVSSALHETRKEHPTEPNHTLPYLTKELKTGSLSLNEQHIVLKDIEKAKGIPAESEAAQVRLTEIVGEISKIKGVDSALKLARHKALKQ